MTRVSFYVLGDWATAGNSRGFFACRLAEKAMKAAAGEHVYLHCRDGAQLAELDDLLWTFRQGSFVAHERAEQIRDLSDAAPVILGGGEPPASIHGVLINLADTVPEFFSRFERVAEIVSPAERETARQRYQFYKDRGYPLDTHRIEQDVA